MHNIFLSIFEKLSIQEDKPQKQLEDFDSFVKPLTIPEVKAKQAELEKVLSPILKTDSTSESIPELSFKIFTLNCIEAKLKELKKNKGED